MLNNTDKKLKSKTKVQKPEKKTKAPKPAKVYKAPKAPKKPKGKTKVSEFILRGQIGNKHPLLEVKNITKQFGSLKALNDVSFSIMPGERIGLIGGNGAGKTTVTEIISGINKPTSGTLTYGFDFDVTPKESIGMQFQQSTYPSGLSVKDIIKFAINLRKLVIKPSELLELMTTFQMEEFYTWKVRALSGGQRQKLNILLSILHNPKLVILDELSTGLDISAREEIINFTDNLLRKMKMSAIVISHHMGEIESLCSKVVVLDRGTVVEIMEIKDIVKKYGSLNNFSRKLISRSNEALRKAAAEGNKNTQELKLDKNKKKSKLAKQVDKQNKVPKHSTPKKTKEEKLASKKDKTPKQPTPKKTNEEKLANKQSKRNEKIKKRNASKKGRHYDFNI